MYKIEYKGKNIQVLAELMKFPVNAELGDIITICSLWEISADLYHEVYDNVACTTIPKLAGVVNGGSYGRSEVHIFPLHHIKSQAIVPYRSCVEIFQDGKWAEWISLHSHQEIVQAIEKVKKHPTQYRIWNITENAVVNLNIKTF